jgi:hypothetical protein
MKSLKLTVEPIPVTSAGNSLNRFLPQHRWDRLRKRIYEEHSHRCAICEVEPRVEPWWVGPVTEQTVVQRALFGRIEPPRRRRHLECHEDWEYDETAHIQRLARLVALCSLCHQVKHWPRART